MLNGAPTLGTMDGANVEIVQEVGAENAFIFGLSSEEVINYENNGGYNPTDIYFNDWELKRVIDQLMDGTYANGDHECIKILYNSSVEYAVYRQSGYLLYSERLPFLCRGSETSGRSLQRSAEMVKNGNDEYDMQREIFL